MPAEKTSAVHDRGRDGNELVEARHHKELGRVPARWTRYEVLVIEEMGYVALAVLAII